MSSDHAGAARRFFDSLACLYVWINPLAGFEGTKDYPSRSFGVGSMAVLAMLFGMPLIALGLTLSGLYQVITLLFGLCSFAAVVLLAGRAAALNRRTLDGQPLPRVRRLDQLLIIGWNLGWAALALAALVS